MQRIVVKIGSSLLEKEKGWLNTAFLENLAKQIKRLQANKKEVILLTSGSVAAGREDLGEAQRDDESLHEKQALAAIGSGSLMQKYYRIFTRENEMRVAQILLQTHDFENLDTIQNAHNTIKILLKKKVLPIVNENEVGLMR